MLTWVGTLAMWVSAEQGNSVVGYKSLSFRFGGPWWSATFGDMFQELC